MKKKEFDKNIALTVNLIKKSKKIILACHMNPDGDAIGSLLALGLGLAKLKKQVVMLCPDKIPERYIELPGARRIKEQYHDIADLAVSIDCGSILQLARLETAFENSKRIVEIDHHLYRTQFGDIQIINRDVCSVSEIIYVLLQKLRIKIDKRIAECLLVSTLIETLSFSRDDLNKGTFNFCSKLMEIGVDYHKVSEKYYWRKKLSVLQLTGLCFTRIQTAAKSALVWAVVYKEDYAEYHGVQSDVDSAADDMMLVKGAKVAILFREIDNNRLRVSLRSDGKINVGELATLYGGGGHRNVAGCRIHKSEQSIQKVIDQATKLVYKK